MKTKTPNIESAAVTARIISRLLKKNGFKMADTSNRYSWTEGFHVHRVGYSCLVSVSYHIPNTQWHYPQIREIAKNESVRVKKFLEDVGYKYSEKQPQYIECLRA
jgi:hypothetical protein